MNHACPIISYELVHQKKNIYHMSYADTSYPEMTNELVEEIFNIKGMRCRFRKVVLIYTLVIYVAVKLFRLVLYYYVSLSSLSSYFFLYS